MKILDLISDPFLLIAEIGNNHQGNVLLAEQMIHEASRCGVHAVKFQKRDNASMYSETLAIQTYDNTNSFGKTYLDHRCAVELSINEFKHLKTYAESLGLIFFATPFDPKSAKECVDLELQLYKVASADLFNYPLIDILVQTGKPIIISSGGASYEDIDWLYKRYSGHNISLMHCTAAYPAPISSMNLRVIPELISRYPKFTIGLSDHENGIDAAQIAYMLGSRIFEKHFTTDRSLKGTDHSFSLEPAGMSKLARNLRRIPDMLGSSIKAEQEIERSALSKMRKSIYINGNIPKGRRITLGDLVFLCPGTEITLKELENVEGSIASRDLCKGQPLKSGDYKNSEDYA